MNKGSLQSSLVMAAGNPNWWNINNSMRAPLQVLQQPLISSPPFSCPNNNNNSNHFLHHEYNITPSSSSSNVWHDDPNQEVHVESWSQLINMGGLEGHEEDNKKLENWESQVLHHQDFEAVSKLTWSNFDQPILPLSSLSSPPKSYVTSGSSRQIVDFSNNNKRDGKHPPPDRSLECNSNLGGGGVKRARVQPSSSNQSTLKVRKEKLGDRIAALHQLVSPFGKTDTASVLMEAIGYIRFLQTQIEALSLPYLGSGPGNSRHQQSERNCIFPEDPGQVHGDEEAKKDLRSRGLCLVPVSSSTLQVGSSNGADYWAPPQLGR